MERAAAGGFSGSPRRAPLCTPRTANLLPHLCQPPQRLCKLVRPRKPRQLRVHPRRQGEQPKPVVGWRRALLPSFSSPCRFCAAGGRGGGGAPHQACQPVRPAAAQRPALGGAPSRGLRGAPPAPQRPAPLARLPQRPALGGAPYGCLRGAFPAPQHPPSPATLLVLRARRARLCAPATSHLTVRTPAGAAQARLLIPLISSSRTMLSAPPYLLHPNHGHPLGTPITPPPLHGLYPHSHPTIHAWCAE
jgi:hypothetical protein